MLKPLTVAVAGLSLFVPDAQLPGDRPAANPRSTRSVVLARNGIVATSQPLASAAGLRVLQQGGNAIDAAVTAAAVLSVVEPTMNGVGGDLFAIVYDAKTKTVRGLNASGRAPAAATPDEFRRRKLDEIPYRGVLSVSVPGVVDGWHELLSKHGTIPLARAVEPAIGYARDGFAVSEIIAAAVEGRREDAGAGSGGGGDVPARPAARRRPATSSRTRTSRRRSTQIARGGRDAFYRGPIAQAIAADMKTRGGLLTAADLAAHHSDWIAPISTTYRGYEVLELPPNTQGVVALEMLNILEGFDVKALGHNSAAYLHLLVEAKRIAFADRAAWLGDFDAVPPDVLARLKSKEYAAERRREIDPAKAAANYKRADARRASRPAAPEPPAARGRHHLHDGCRPRGQRRLADSIHLRKLRRRHRRRRHGHHAAQPRQPVLAAAGTSELARAGQAAVPYPRAGDGDERQPAVAVVRRDGRRHAAAGARAGAAQPDRLRHERAGSRRGRTLQTLSRGPRARIGDLVPKPAPASQRAVTA